MACDTSLVRAHEIDYILCMDGGASKTLLQAVDSKNGQIVQIFKDNISSDHFEGPGANFTYVGEEGIKSLLQILGTVRIGNDQLLLSDIISRCRIVAGFAGVGRSEPYEKVKSLFKNWGVKEDNIYLTTDAVMNLNLIPKDGAILIAGTGSICLGKKGWKSYSVGGFGKVLGDEGSGYYIGLKAIKAGLEEQRGYGQSPLLREKLCAFFEVDELNPLIGKVTSGEIPAGKVAKFAPIVFELAFQAKDPVAKSIIEKAERSLGKLVSKMIAFSGLTNGEIHLVGGLFKSQYSSQFVEGIFKGRLGEKSIQVVNKANDNAALIYAQQEIATSSLIEKE